MPYKIFCHPPYGRLHDKIACAACACIVSIYGYSSVLSPEVDESTIHPAAGSRCSVSPLEVYILLVVASWSLLHCLTEYF